MIPLKADTLQKIGSDVPKHNDLDGRAEANAHPDTAIEITETYTGNLAGVTTQKESNDVLDAFTSPTPLITSVDSTLTVVGGQASVTNPLPEINDTETIVNSFGENISNPRITVDEFGHTNVKQVDSITVVTKNTPTLTSNSDANLTCNFSATTAWIAFAENTTSVTFTNNQAEINFQYVWDTEQESNLIAIMDGGRYAYGGNIELRIGGVWTKIIDFTLDDYSSWDSNTVNYLLFTPTPFNTDQIGQYLFTLPRKIKHTGIRINWTTFEPTWNSINVRGVIVADANFTYRSLLKTSYNSDRHQALQIYDRITNDYTSIVQPYFDRWRYTVDSSNNILLADVVAGTLYRMLGSAKYLEAPSWAYTGIAYKFAVCNFTVNANSLRLRSTGTYAFYKGKLYQGVQNIPIPPYSTFTCTLVGTRYYVIECSSPNSIQFPATAVASTDANELDDYEEGTANIAFTAGSGTITYGDRALAYCKVGRVVSLHGQLTVSAVSGTQTGTLTITGLPFTSASGNSYQSEIAVSISGGHGDMTGYRLRGYVINNTNTLRIEAIDISDGSLVDIADLITTSSIITVGGVYYANS